MVAGWKNKIELCNQQESGEQNYIRHLMGMNKLISVGIACGMMQNIMRCFKGIVGMYTTYCAHLEEPETGKEVMVNE